MSIGSCCYIYLSVVTFIVFSVYLPKNKAYIKLAAPVPLISGYVFIHDYSITMLRIVLLTP